MVAQDIIIKPILSEKSYADIANKKYTFKVAKDANKTQIKQAIEEIFNVKVAQVNVVNVKPRTKRMGKYVGKTKNLKKAYITLKEGSKITILQDK